MSEIRKTLINRIPAEWGRYISCDSGWDWILEDLEIKISYIDPSYQIHQVKEKYGTLRFYCSSEKDPTANQIISDLTRIAEELSSKTCELCGNSSARSNKERGYQFDGTVALRYNGGCYKTLCKTCGDSNNFVLEESD